MIMWKPIENHPFYEVSDDGDVARRGFDGTHTVLKPARSGVGYLVVNLPNEIRSRRTAYVHRLVAGAFIGPCPTGLVVNHRDGNKLNNRPENLEYVSRTTNNQHAYKHKLNRGPCRLTDGQIQEIRELCKTNTQAAVARKFGINQCHVSRLVSGKRRKNND